MASLLRKVKSTIYATTTSNVDTPVIDQSPSRSRVVKLQKKISASEVNSTTSLSSACSTVKHHKRGLNRYTSIADISRKLVHKHSTLNLRSKNWTIRSKKSENKSENKRLEEQDQLNTPSCAKEKDKLVYKTQVDPRPLDELEKPYIPSIKSNSVSHQGLAAGEEVQKSGNKSAYNTTAQNLRDPEIGSSGNTSETVNSNSSESNNYEQSTPKSKSTGTAKMSVDASNPPVPFARLKEIADSACHSVFSDVNSYNHSSTETWNTTIINSVLGTLVKETTSTTTNTSAQPQFKYIVNSTIIQHAPTSSGDESNPAVSGRRGMHAASGAYWNNEKDGMFSYKYQAAESKGLDVIVGITWIWIG